MLSLLNNDNPKLFATTQPIRIGESVSPVYVFRTKREDPTNAHQVPSATSCHGGVRIHHAGPISIFKLQVCFFICGLLAHRLLLTSSTLNLTILAQVGQGKGPRQVRLAARPYMFRRSVANKNFMTCQGAYNACPLGLGLLVKAVCVSTVPRLLRCSVKGLTLCTRPSF